MGTGAHSDQTDRGHSLGNTDEKKAKCCAWEGGAAGNRTDLGLSAWGTALLKRKGLGSCWADTELSQLGALAAFWAVITEALSLV